MVWKKVKKKFHLVIADSVGPFSPASLKSILIFGNARCGNAPSWAVAAGWLDQHYDRCVRSGEHVHDEKYSNQGILFAFHIPSNLTNVKIEYQGFLFRILHIITWYRNDTFFLAYFSS